MSTATDTRTADFPPIVRRRLEKLEAEVDQLKNLVASFLGPEQGLHGRSKQPQRRALHVPTAPSETPDTIGLDDRGLAGAQLRGEVVRVQWVRDGEVVPTQTLAKAWGLTPQALGSAIMRGEVFALKVGNKRYFPREFLQLERQAVAAVCHALGGLSPSEKLVFWTREHGALSGKTISLSIASGVPLLRLTQLAHAWADERGAANGSESA